MSIISKPNLAAFLFDCGIGCEINLEDEWYAMPDEDWIFGDLANYLRFYLKNRFPAGYQAQRADCDDWAGEAHTEVLKIHRQTPFDDEKWQESNGLAVPGKCGCAWGKLGYVPSSGLIGHKINISVVRQKALPKLVFFEPNGCTRVWPEPTREELNKCSSCSFH